MKILTQLLLKMVETAKPSCMLAYKRHGMQLHATKAVKHACNWIIAVLLGSVSLCDMIEANESDDFTKDAKVNQKFLLIRLA